LGAPLRGSRWQDRRVYQTRQYVSRTNTIAAKFNRKSLGQTLDRVLGRGIDRDSRHPISADDDEVVKHSEPGVALRRPIAE